MLSDIVMMLNKYSNNYGAINELKKSGELFAGELNIEGALKSIGSQEITWT